MKRQFTPFVLVTVAAARGQSITLSPEQCRVLANDDHFFDRAINELTVEEFDSVAGEDAIADLSGFARLDSDNPASET